MKILDIHDLTKRLEETLHVLKEESETIEVTDGSEVIAYLIPVRKTQQPDKRDLKTFWQEIDQLAAEIGAHWKGDFDAVDAVRDVRRDL